MKPLERSFYIAIYPSGKIVEKHLTRNEAVHYCKVFNRTLPHTIAWANFRQEIYTPPGQIPINVTQPPSKN